MQNLLLAANTLSFSQIPTLFWVASLTGILCAVFLGFISGLFYAKTDDARSLEKAGKQFNKLFELTTLRLKQANQACSQLEKISPAGYQEKDRAILERLQASISEKISNCLGLKKTVKETIEEEKEVDPIEWKTESIDPETLLPNQESIKANFDQMLEYSRLSDQPCGVLLCRIDKFSKLESRIGKQTINYFRRKLASLLIRSLTETDLVCQLDRSTYMILMPDSHNEETSALIEQVIRAVRGYHFRNPDTDQEILVTASFGYTTCQLQDSFDTLSGRILNAVTKSEKCGRNQLHIHNGTQSVHSLIS